MIIDHHYNGPPGMGHGGVTAGRLAALIEPDAARVRLHRPVPLGTALDAVRTDDGAAVVDGDAVIATVTDLERPLTVGSFSAPSTTDLHRAESTWLDARDGHHFAPTCFACGPARNLGGLGLRPGPIGDSADTYACRWRPEGSGRLPAWLIWAAMDCPTGFPALARVEADEAVVTGELAVQVLSPVRAGATYSIVSRVTGRDGRRFSSEAALLDSDGHALVVAEATWFAVPLERIAPVAVATAA